MFGMEEDLKKLKTAMQAMDCDTAVLRNWQRSYEKARKQLPSVMERYHSARNTIVRVEDIMKQLEQKLIDVADWDRQELKELQSALKELKKMQNTFDHELLVSREDKEFHLTYDTILKLGAKMGSRHENRIILQSEIENILALLKEDLEKDRPDFFALSFFYLNHTDKDLIDLPPVERLERIDDIYQTEFLDLLCSPLTRAIVKSDGLQDSLEHADDRKARRVSEEIRILWNKEGEHLTAEERAKNLVEGLCTV